MSIAGKVALVTGSAGGLGAAHVAYFVEHGAVVMASDIRDDEGTEIVSGLGDSAEYMRLDVTSPEDWSAAITATMSRFGRLDILINNAGQTPVAAIEDITVEHFMDVQKINLLGPLLGIQAAAKVMGPGSLIINIGSIDALHGVAGLAGYVSSKAGLGGLTKVAALELARDGIRVLCLHLGAMDTPMFYDAGERLVEQGLLPGGGDLLPRINASIPLGRIGSPKQIAAWSAFLASDDANWATGTEFVIDGGALTGRTPPPRRAR